MAKRPTQDIKNKTSRSTKTKKRATAKRTRLEETKPRRGSVRANRAKQAKKSQKAKRK